MSDAFAQLTPGTELDSGVGPFNLTWFNAVTEAVRAKMRSDQTPAQHGFEIQFDPWIWLANISGEPIPQYTAVGLGELSILPGDNTDFKHRLSFLSAALADGEPFGIAQDPIEQNARFVAKSSVSAGEQPPPNPAKWVRLLGDADAWDSGTRYVIGQQVTVSAVAYACVKPHYNITPPDADYWVVVGTNVGVWKVGDTYSATNVVNLPTVGRLVVDGTTRVLVDVLDAAHQYAGIVGGELKSMADPGPLFFLWKEGGTGEQWAVVRFDEQGATLAFKTIAVSGQSDVVADSATDTLTLAAGSNITLTTNANTDTVTIAAANAITSINGLTGPGITHAVGTSGADHNIAASGFTVTHNIPDASSSNRGLVTTGTQTFAGAKTVTSVFTINTGTTSPPPTLYLKDGTTGGAKLNSTVGWTYSQSYLTTAPISYLTLSAIDDGVNDYHTTLTLQGGYGATSVDDTHSSNDSASRYAINVGGTAYRGKWGTDASGNVVSGGIITTLSTGPISVSKGGTGAASLTSGSLIVGNGTSALSSVATTRVSGGNLQLKLASDSWIEFGEASY